MRTFSYYTLLGFLISGSAYLAICRPRSVDNVSGEIITLISILSAAVIACIFSVSKNSKFVKTRSDKRAIYLVSNYWIRFFFVCALCSVSTIVGKLLDWPMIEFNDIGFDVLGFVTLSSLSILFGVMLLQLPLAIRDVLFIENEFNEIDKVEDFVPDFDN